jgi:hypothetical protein
MNAVHVEIIKLIVAYTLAGAFVFTAVITCLSLVGVVKLPTGLQKKLYGVLILEVATVCVGFFSDLLRLDPRVAQRRIEQPFRDQVKSIEGEKVKLSQEKDTALAEAANVPKLETDLATARAALSEAQKEWIAKEKRFKAKFEELKVTPP